MSNILNVLISDTHPRKILRTLNLDLKCPPSLGENWYLISFDSFLKQECYLEKPFKAYCLENYYHLSTQALNLLYQVSTQLP